MDEETGLDLGSEGSEDPFAGVPADLGAEGGQEEDGGTPRLGGEGATLDDLSEEAEAPEGEQEDPAAEEPEPEPEAELDPEPTKSVAEPEPESKPAKASKGKKANGKKEGTASRPYFVLYAIEGGFALVRPEPIVASQAVEALREAYSELVPADSEDEIELVVVPAHFWKPRKVSAKKKVSRAVEIS